MVYDMLCAACGTHCLCNATPVERNAYEPRGTCLHVLDYSVPSGSTGTVKQSFTLTVSCVVSKSWTNDNRGTVCRELQRHRWHREALGGIETYRQQQAEQQELGHISCCLQRSNWSKTHAGTTPAPDKLGWSNVLPA